MWCDWQVLAENSRMKSHKNTKIGIKLPTRRAIMRTIFYVKRSKVKVTRLINAETECVSPIWTSNLIGGWCMRYQLPRPGIKVCDWSWVIARRRGHNVSAVPGSGHIICFVIKSYTTQLKTVWCLGQFKRSLKTFLFGLWDHGALWHTH